MSVKSDNKKLILHGIERIIEWVTAILSISTKNDRI